MNRLWQRTIISVKALRQLGAGALLQYAWYRLMLQSGWLEKTAPEEERAYQLNPQAVLHLPEREKISRLLGQAGMQGLLAEAEEILSGKVRLFGGKPVDLNLAPPGPLVHWSRYERGLAPWGAKDVKLIWEPARFGWAFTLGRAYFLSGDERCAAAFWGHTEAFLDVNPTNLGPNWASAQEAALRLMAFVFALAVFADSPHTTPVRAQRLAKALAEHAARIPITLAYARAQHNNHLLTEAAALYTAGLALPEHPSARRWLALGKRWLNTGLQEQIDPDGNYAQHSTNYHRLMLQTALWAQALQTDPDRPVFTPATLKKLEQAARWLRQLLDPISGETPNLGPNDGAYIFPFTSCPFNDYRPVVQAAALAFQNERPMKEGPWDEMVEWFNCPEIEQLAAAPISAPALSIEQTPHILQAASSGSWAYLRAARFRSRPGHADQLHLDLWWRGLNLALDPGTYFYNAPDPWENALAHTLFHNTVSVNGQAQMCRAGRFLWLDWAQAQAAEAQPPQAGEPARLSAQHDGYRRLGVIHRRQAAVEGETWLIEDLLDKPENNRLKDPLPPIQARLHWLLPDWEWEAGEEPGQDNFRLGLKSPYGKVVIEISARHSGEGAGQAQASLVRAGELLYGPGPAAPQSGWFSPTYAHKIPALSLSYSCSSTLPILFITRWALPIQT